MYALNVKYERYPETEIIIDDNLRCRTFDGLLEALCNKADAFRSCSGTVTITFHPLEKETYDVR